MTFDLGALQRAVRREGRVVRVVLAQCRGSTPREPGAEMRVWASGQDGSIGGGRLEYDAIAQARAMLPNVEAHPRVTTLALGPSLGQCCGGSVVLVSEVFTPQTVPQAAQGPAYLRALSANAPPCSESLGDKLMDNGWLRDPWTQPGRPVWIWGAGHVGRALANVPCPLPDFRLWIVDSRAGELAHLNTGVPLLARDPVMLMPSVPPGSFHVVATHCHDTDFAICDGLLRHRHERGESRSAAWVGLIGSATKKARFLRRLGEIGHKSEAINAITCPIGDPSLGKHPQAIAVGVATALLAQNVHEKTEEARI